MVILKKIHSLFLGIVFPVLSLITFPQYSVAQLSTSNSLTPTQLVQTVLLGGGVTASNITYNGAPIAIGSFNGLSSNIGLPGGVIMSSGDIANSVGPNNQSGASTSNSLPGDPDLDQIMSPTLSYDAAILEFDFVPTSDTVKFRYVFGSEEYMEYVSATPGGINDGFGFFISGPGIVGPFSNNAKNIALVPGTALPVTMFNLNLNSNGVYYFDNGSGNGGGTASDGLTVQYDGFTVVLTAITAVQCGQTYHIKIAIADGGDGILDSGVFLEAGSFSSSGGAVLTAGTVFGGTVSGNDSTIYEGCGFASLLVDRGSNNSASAATFFYSITGDAINGVDYSPIGDSVYFAAGQDSAYIIISSLPDAIIEGTEIVTISLFVVSTCNGNDTLSKTIYIVDTPPLKVMLNDDTSIVCPSQNLFLTATTFGGVAIGSYSYSWTNSTGTKDTIHINPQMTTTYVVTVTDSCGHSASDTSVVNFVPYTPMQLALNNDTIICGGGQLLLDANVVSGLPDYTYLWSPNVTALDTVTVKPPVSTFYHLTVTDQCGYSIMDSVDVTVYSIAGDFQYLFTTNQNVAFENLSSYAVSYYWNFGDASDDSTSTLADPEHYYATDGTYNVMLVSVNQNGCADTTYRTVTIIPDFYFYFPNAFSPNKNGKNDVFTGVGDGIKSYRMRIFDRWGRLIFESVDIDKGWDGTYKGVPAPFAVYVCVFDVESFSSKKSRRMGSVTLLR